MYQAIHSILGGKKYRFCILFYSRVTVNSAEKPQNNATAGRFRISRDISRSNVADVFHFRIKVFPQLAIILDCRGTSE